jgi:large subunit ribosomal protein L10
MWLPHCGRTEIISKCEFYKELTLSLNRSEKQVVVDEVAKIAAKSQTLVMAEYRGIAVVDLTKLRQQARDKGVYMRVLKNTLARRAVAGTSFDVAANEMTGPLIYGFSEDAVAAAKVVNEFAKTNDKLLIRAGAYSGRALDKAGVQSLANIPSREVLLAQIAGLLQSPMAGLARVLAAVSAKQGTPAPEVVVAQPVVAEAAPAAA